MTTRILLWAQDGHEVIITGLFELACSPCIVPDLVKGWRKAEEEYVEQGREDLIPTFSQWCKSHLVDCVELFFSDVDTYSGEYM